jgi:ribonuclease HI
MINVYIDGASRGNPGEAGIGILIKSDNGDTVFSAAGYGGKMTNNQAEYHALIAALTKIKKSPSLLVSSGTESTESINIHSDSELVVRQLNGQYKVKEPELKKLYDTVNELIKAIPSRIVIKHIKREQNREADRLANAGIDSKIPLIL